MAAKIPNDHASKIASELLGVPVGVSELPGYVDANFKITTFGKHAYAHEIEQSKQDAMERE